MNTMTAVTMAAGLMSVPLLAGWLRRRPMTELDRRLSAVDAALDARRS